MRRTLSPSRRPPHASSSLVTPGEGKEGREEEEEDYFSPNEEEEEAEEEEEVEEQVRYNRSRWCYMKRGGQVEGG